MLNFCHKERKTIELILWERHCVQLFQEKLEYYLEEKKNNFRVTFNNTFFYPGHHR